MKQQKNCSTTNLHCNPENAWFEGDYREVILFVSAAPGGYFYKITEGKKLLHRAFVIACGNASAAALEHSAKEIGRQWVKTHAPDAVVRLRSASERRRLFGDYVTGDTYPNVSRSEGVLWAA